MNAGNKPAPRIQRPATRAHQLATQRKRLERHEYEVWEREQHQRRSAGLPVVKFPGLDKIEALRAGAGDAQETEENSEPGAGTVAEAFAKIGTQSTGD